jgi:hypothetical protein
MASSCGEGKEECKRVTQDRPLDLGLMIDQIIDSVAPETDLPNPL